MVMWQQVGHCCLEHGARLCISDCLVIEKRMLEKRTAETDGDTRRISDAPLWWVWWVYDSSSAWASPSVLSLFSLALPVFTRAHEPLLRLLLIIMSTTTHDKRRQPVCC